LKKIVTIHKFETQRSNLNIKLANVVVDQLKWSVKEYAYVIRHWSQLGSVDILSDRNAVRCAKPSWNGTD